MSDWSVRISDFGLARTVSVRLHTLEVGKDWEQSKGFKNININAIN
jgi:hypothetical protein